VRYQAKKNDIVSVYDVILGTFAINKFNRRNVVHLGKKISELDVSGLRRNVIHQNDSKGLICREVVHGYKSSRSVFPRSQSKIAPRFSCWSNILLSTWHYENECQLKYQDERVQMVWESGSMIIKLQKKNRRKGDPVLR